MRRAISALQQRVSRRPLILVVDDDPAILEVLNHVLSYYGIDSKLASNSVAALSEYQRHQKQIGAALIDVQMPDFDGPAVLSLLRAVNPNLKACFMTGHSEIHSAEALELQSGRPMVQKPFRGLDFIALTLWKMVDESSN